ncbi:MAG: glutamate formimidoyltransferase [marine benthic group bacterium]|jgi:glutamate formiminotransferase|nr:glutamate formimidoyltransferase [Gemmatimonadota bacterium]
MAKVLMCKANISEGRRKEVLEGVANAVRAVAGVTLADWSGDPDHNRAVYTLLGSPEAVLEGAKALTESALENIDMSTHEGEHPRMGAVDVVPFIPLREMESDEAVGVAREYGAWLGARGVPVFYYEYAATRPERESLPKIRKGQYEALPEKLQDPAWEPDEGPAEFNPRSGATVTGARFPLVAFNVNLKTDDLEIAQTIARAVRHINGGYRFVRGMGFALEDKGMVQVSMNLVNYEKTPIHRVLETIRSEASRYGVQIAGTELIGSVPLGALEEVVRFYLQTHDFAIDQIVETALLD